MLYRGMSSWNIITITLFLVGDVTQYISTAYRGLNIAQSCYPSLNNEDIVLLKLFVPLYADAQLSWLRMRKELQLEVNINNVQGTSYLSA